MSLRAILVVLAIASPVLGQIVPRQPGAPPPRVPIPRPADLPPPGPPPPVERLEQRGSTKWHVLRKDQREYVRFSDVESFYSFENMDIIGDEVILESPSKGLTFRFLAGLRQAQFKTYTCYLSFPPVRFQERIYLSRVDLSLLLDPTIRPSSMTLSKEGPVQVLVEVRASDKLAIDVARYLRTGLEAFEIKVITSLADAPKDESILCGVRLLQGDDLEELQTLILAPKGSPTHEEKKVPPGLETTRGNQQDRLNAALGLAVHATLMEHAEGVLDGGLTRSRLPFLQHASRPAVAIRLPGAASTSAEVLGAAIVSGLRRFREAVAR